MSDNDLTFFTNEPENTLYERFNKILNRNTQFFDILVGYFRASGFYLIKDSLKNVEKTRILIGINADKHVLEMYEESQSQIKEFNLSNIQAIKDYKEDLEKEFENSEDSELVEDGVNEFVELLKNGKLELRLYTKQPIHAKIYIMKDHEDSPDYGRVITGSSNFSQSGLVNNLEFNVELKNSADVKFAQSKFEELWKESVEINEACIDTIESKTWVKSDITPYEMYVKFLYEYFKEEINDDISANNDSLKYYPLGFKPLQYQKDAVIQAKRTLEKHNGVFISDVVGLGKTYICALLAQELEGKKLILCPPVLKEYWENVMRDFGVRGVKVESTGKLDKIIEEDSEQYRYVFVDESHRFRNADTEQYKLLHQICVGKKVILISATPQNNYNSDIANQLYLFQSRTKSTLVNARNLENFFARLRKKENSFEKGSEEYKKAVRENSEEIRDKILREIMIRRTRTEIQNTYADDLKKQKLTFPKVGEPKKLIYEFSEQTDKEFEETIQSITKLSYARYKPLTYINPEKLTSDQNKLLIGQTNMGGFMKGILVKRLESSKYAFEKTIERFISSYREFIDMYNSGTVWVSKKLNVQDLLDEEDLEKLESAAERNEAMKFDSKSFRDEFIDDLEKDLEILNNLQKRWQLIKTDDKLKCFIKELKENSKLDKNNKLIIFSESKETVEYLKNEIEARLNEKVIDFSGSMPEGTRNNIRANFDPNYNKEKQKNDYRILITTDVLAEGINLHRSNVIINYDLPWNPTKIMQRVGRVNRVGTTHKEIFVFNFFPTSKSNEQMSLEENIINKIQMFHDILGEDSKYLTDEEEVSTHELFTRMNVKIDDESEQINSELSYLKTIRDIRDNDKELFNKIKNYPKKIKIGRSKENINGLITFFRKGYLKKFYLSKDNECNEINFETAIKYVESNKKEYSKKITNEYYNLLRQNKKAFEEEEKENENGSIVVTDIRGTSNAKNIISVLKLAFKLDCFTEIEFENIDSIIKMLENGDLPNRIVKEGNKLIKTIRNQEKDIAKFYKEFEKTIPKVYFQKIENNIEKAKTKEVKEIILSEYFI